MFLINIKEFFSGLIHEYTYLISNNFVFSQHTSFSVQEALLGHLVQQGHTKQSLERDTVTCHEKL
jgi:hypothetical protein